MPLLCPCCSAPPYTFPGLAATASGSVPGHPPAAAIDNVAGSYFLSAGASPSWTGLFRKSWQSAMRVYAGARSSSVAGLLRWRGRMCVPGPGQQGVEYPHPTPAPAHR